MLKSPSSKLARIFGNGKYLCGFNRSWAGLIFCRVKNNPQGYREPTPAHLLAELKAWQKKAEIDTACDLRT